MSKFIYVNLEDGNRFEVSFDEEELRKFRDEVIENASLVTHHDYVGHHGPFYKSEAPDPVEIRNYTASLVGSDDRGNLIRFQYDKYEFPALTNYIRELLEGDYIVFDKIYNPTYEEEAIPILSEFKAVSEEIYSSRIYGKPVKNMDELVDQLLNLLEKYRTGDYIIPVAKYYEDAKKLFEVKKLDNCKTLTKE